jgi:hypothetical protein
MKLLYSPKGSPFVDLGDGYKVIFSTITAGDDGIKYLIFSNTPLEKPEEIVHRVNFITNMKMKTNGEDRSVAIPKEFKRTNIYRAGYVAALKRMIEKHLTKAMRFPFSAFPKLEKDIEHFNGDEKAILKNIDNTEIFEDGRKNNRIGGKKKAKKVKAEKKEKPEKVEKKKNIKLIILKRPKNKKQVFLKLKFK